MEARSEGTRRHSAGRRRTQSERSAETRGRLLDATIESLVEVGYAQTTTRRVTERAGVSQGAQAHHFPHRVDLVASAFARLAEQRLERYRERAGELPGDPATRLRGMLDLLWDDFSSEFFQVAAKLWVAAADDDELRERLIPVERRIYANVASLAAAVAGDLAERPGFDQYLTVAMNTVAGLGMMRWFDPRGRIIGEEQWHYHRDALERMLPAGSNP